MLRKRIDAKRSQLFLDTCAFDPKYSPEDEAAQRLWSLSEQERIHLVLSHSNQREVDHPNTPGVVKERALSMIFTLEVPLTPGEILLKGRIERLLQGNAVTNKHKDDAEHLFEASKYGGYFITTDRRILDRRAEIFDICTVQVMTPSSAISQLSFCDTDKFC